MCAPRPANGDLRGNDRIVKTCPVKKGQHSANLKLLRLYREKTKFRKKIKKEIVKTTECFMTRSPLFLF